MTRGHRDRVLPLWSIKTAERVDQPNKKKEDTMITMPALHLGRGTQAGPLTIFPIWTDAPMATHRPYTTTLRGRGAVTELPDHPEVSTLVVTQPGPKPLLMLEGALLSGGWQHRVLTRDILIAAGAPVLLDVRCVEAGRWQGETTQSTERRAAPLAVRGALRGIRPDQSGAREDDQNLRSADQGDVWNRVTAYEHRFGAGPTSSLVDVQCRHEQEVDRIVREVRPLFGQRGVLIGVAGHPVLLEVFDHHRTLVELLRTIVASVALDAIGLTAAPTSNSRARQFVQRLQRAQLTATDREPGFTNRAAGDDLLHVQSLDVAHSIVHAAALNVRHELVLAA